MYLNLSLSHCPSFENINVYSMYRIFEVVQSKQNIADSYFQLHHLEFVMQCSGMSHTRHSFRIILTIQSIKFRCLRATSCWWLNERKSENQIEIGVGMQLY